MQVSPQLLSPKVRKSFFLALHEQLPLPQRFFPGVIPWSRVEKFIKQSKYSRIQYNRVKHMGKLTEAWKISLAAIGT